jgi:hypothetical protein
VASKGKEDESRAREDEDDDEGRWNEDVGANGEEIAEAEEED